MSSDSLDGRVIAIAGIGGGLGPVVAERLAEAGATVCGADREQAHADAVEESLGLPDDRWDGRAVDLLEEEEAVGWCAALVERFGRVDGLMHLVGGWRGGEPLRTAPLADWDLLHDLLIRTVQHTTRAFHDALVASPAGRFVARLGQAGAGPVESERRLRSGKGCSGGLDAGARRRLLQHRRHGQHRRHRGDPHPADARGEPGRGIPYLHPRGAHRRRDCIPLLRRGRGDERAAVAAYDEVRWRNLPTGR